MATEILRHTAAPRTFPFSPFLRQTHNHKLFPHGASTNGDTNNHHHDSRGPSLVCKHWLRGLCKKGEHCEFLHEYNLRKMPECNFFTRNGYCSNGEECLYLHIDPQSKLPPCPHYDQGFCPLGPECAKKHVRKKLCVLYLAGFCPDGPACKEGAHPKWKTDLERPKAKSEVKREEGDGLGGAGAAGGRRGGDQEMLDVGGHRDRDERGFGGDRDRERDRDGRHGGHRGRAGKWRGPRRFRGRGGY